MSITRNVTLVAAITGALCTAPVHARNPNAVNLPPSPVLFEPGASINPQPLPPGRPDRRATINPQPLQPLSGPRR